MKKIFSYEKYKWYICAVVGFFVFQIGYVLAVINTILENRYGLRKNKSILYSGIAVIIFSVFFGGCMLLGMASNDISDIWIPALIYIPPFSLGVYMLAVYFIIGSKCKWRSRCFSLVYDNHITSIESISEITGLRTEKVIKYVRQLAVAGYLKGVEIDEKHLEILLKNNIWAHQKVICQKCGAELIINLGQTLVCEYCGSLIKFN